MNFGAKLRKIRIENGLSQDDLAKKINCASNSVSQWENNRRQPDIEMINKIANILDINTGYFFEDNNETLDEKETFFTQLLTLLVKQNKIKKIEDLNENQLKMIRAAINQQIEEINKAKD